MCKQDVGMWLFFLVGISKKHYETLIINTNSCKGKKISEPNQALVSSSLFIDTVARGTHLITQKESSQPNSCLRRSQWYDEGRKRE